MEERDYHSNQKWFVMKACPSHLPVVLDEQMQSQPSLQLNDKEVDLE